MLQHFGHRGGGPNLELAAVYNKQTLAEALSQPQTTGAQPNYRLDINSEYS